MAPGDTASRIDTISLDIVARRYEAFLRARRMPRGQIAMSVGHVLAFPTVVLPSLYVFPSSDAPMPPWFAPFMILVAPLAGSFAFIVFFAFRAVMAGSRRAAWIVLGCLAPLLVFMVAGLFSVDQTVAAYGSVASIGKKAELIRVVIIVYQLPPVILLYLMAFGVVCFIRNRASDMSALFVDHNYDRQFWIRWRVLVRNFCHLMGLSAPPRRGGMPIRVTAAATLALICEGCSYAM